jgi:hypothetical protein
MEARIVFEAWGMDSLGHIDGGVGYRGVGCYCVCAALE